MVKKSEEAGPEKSEKEKEPQKDQAKPPKESSLKTPTLVTGLLVSGFIASIVASYGVQYYRDTYVIPPQKEKTFPFLTRHDSQTKNLRSVSSNGALLRFAKINDQGDFDVNFRLLVGERFVSLDEMDYYEHSFSDVYNSGKLTFSFEGLPSSISYIIHPENSTLTTFIRTDLKDPHGNRTEYNITSQFGYNGNLIIIPIVQESRKYQAWPSEDNQPFTSTEEIDIQLANAQKKWAEDFESKYLLEKQKMPKAYQDIAASAISFLMNSFKHNKTVQLLGVYDKNFTRSERFNHLESNHYPMNTLDEQVFPLVVMSTYDLDDCLKVLNSWINLVNELGFMGNQIEKDGIRLNKIQSPLLFQLVKELLRNPEFKKHVKSLIPNLDYIADHTWKNSIGPAGLKDVKWLGHSRGIFQLEPATPKGESSFELFCLLEDMSRVMTKLYEISGSTDSKWKSRVQEIQSALNFYFDKESKLFGDLKEGKFQKSQSSHTPLILSLLSETSEELGAALRNLQQDDLFTSTGLQLSETHGASISTNFLLLQSLKRYSSLSGSSQELAHQMYSVLKNNLIAAIARSNRLEKSFYGRFDKDMRPLGFRGHLDGALVVLIMADLHH